MDMTLHTGFPGDEIALAVEWSDHNNVKHRERIEIAIVDRDKPRILQIIINGRLVHKVIASWI